MENKPIAERHLGQGFSTGDGITPPPTMGQLTMSEDISHCHNWENAGGTQWEEASDGARHPTVHMTAPYNKELFGPKCQQCHG